jgi:hypothetical protein
LLPILNQLSQVKPQDPANYATREDFTRSVEIAFAKANAYAELMKLLSEQEAVMNRIRKEIDKPDKNYQTGT